MKILSSGYHNPHYATFTEYAEAAIRRSGRDLITFDDAQFIIPGRFRDMAAFLQKWDLERMNRKFLSLARKHKPDLCLVMGGYRILPETIKRIKEEGITCALWTTDPPFDFNLLMEIGPLYDFIFCAGTEAVELFNKAGIRGAIWVPFACESETQKRRQLTEEERRAYGCDVAFVGTVDPDYYPVRVECLEAISDFNIGIWGPGAEKIPSSSPVKSRVRGQKTTPEIWTRIYSASKIVLCMHYRNPKRPALCYQASPRVFEALACASFLLTDDQADVNSVFEDGRHLVVFKDPADLRKKVEYYLARPEERARIAAAGYEEVMRKHTYANRIENIFAVIGGKRR